MKYEIGRWQKLYGYAAPGGTPIFACEKCGGCEHLHGAEYPKRKIFCDKCGTINLYPWEEAYELED